MYSKRHEIDRFFARIANGATAQRKPLCVLDMDGNILIGYNVRDASRLPPPSANANIPADADIAALEKAGVIEAAIFAAKPMDARLPPALVARMNALEQAGERFSIAILTSRSYADALEILRRSGVANPAWHTLVSDSGANIAVNGQCRAIAGLNAADKAFLDGLHKALPDWEAEVDSLLQRLHFSPHDRPALHLEEKGIASNIHFREILAHYGQAENTLLAERMRLILQDALENHIHRNAPEGAFHLMHGPATLEVKHGGIDKGKGLQAVLDAALAGGVQPSCLVFAGDDICTRDADGTVHKGTDYAAFAAAPRIAQASGIPVYTIHTQHPENGDLHSRTPAPRKQAPADLSPDLIVPTPIELGKLVERICGERVMGKLVG